ncbi:hypothetical protein [Priestia flexa]|nr:hypothetical protein [Priestia flexa]
MTGLEQVLVMNLTVIIINFTVQLINSTVLVKEMRKNASKRD